MNRFQIPEKNPTALIDTNTGYVFRFMDKDSAAKLKEILNGEETKLRTD